MMEITLEKKFGQLLYKIEPNSKNKLVKQQRDR